VAPVDTSWKVDVRSLPDSWSLAGSVHIHSAAASRYVLHDFGELLLSWLQCSEYLKLLCYLYVFTLPT